MESPKPDISWNTRFVITMAEVEFALGLQKYVVLGTGRTVTKIVKERMRYSRDSIRFTLFITMNLQREIYYSSLLPQILPLQSPPSPVLVKCNQNDTGVHLDHDQHLTDIQRPVQRCNIVQHNIWQRSVLVSVRQSFVD